MTIVARRRAAMLVPWIALVAVTVFAIVQLRARRRSEAEDCGPIADERAVETVTAGPSAAAALASEEALDAALRDLEAARDEAASLGRRHEAAATRAEDAQAQLETARARVAALVAQVAGLEAEADGLREAAAAAPPAREPRAVEDPSTWVENAASGDRERRGHALRRAAEADAEEIAALVDHAAAGGDALGVARIAAALPPSDDADALVIALVGAEGADARILAALGSERLRRPAVLKALLGRASPGMLKVALGWLAGHEAGLGDEAARRELTAALAPRLASEAMKDLHAGARAAGILRLPGLAPRLVALLGREAPEVRAVAAHALSRVPDLGMVRADAVKALPGLLLDDSLAVRTAGAMLAVVLLGRDVDYDPAAGEGARREAVDALLDQLD